MLLREENVRMRIRSAADTTRSQGHLPRVLPRSDLSRKNKHVHRHFNFTAYTHLHLHHESITHYPHPLDIVQQHHAFHRPHIRLRWRLHTFIQISETLRHHE
jgi:hypothetical protein